MTNPSSALPMHRQYERLKRQLKKRYPDAILFFQLGDFYETFDEDARVVAQVCEIVLTSRAFGRDLVGTGRRADMAGVPVHAADGYIAKLIAAGHRVAICNQMEDPSVAKGLVRREIVRIVTPGTVVEPGLLDAHANNYLAALLVERGQAGLAYADVSTGEFRATQLPAERVGAELDRIGPVEILVPRGLETPGRTGLLTPLEPWQFEAEAAKQALRDQLAVATLDGFGWDHRPLAIRVAGALVQYLKETQPSAAAQLDDPVVYSTSAYMALDAQTRRNLEIEQAGRTGGARGSLLAILDCTRTPLGGRLLRRWLGQPLLDLDQLRRRQSLVAALVDDAALRAAVRAELDEVADLERILNRIAMEAVHPRELLALRRSLLAAARLRERIGGQGLDQGSMALSREPNPPAPFPRPEGTREGGVLDDDASARQGGVLDDDASARQGGVRVNDDSARERRAVVDDDSPFPGALWAREGGRGVRFSPADPTPDPAALAELAAGLRPCDEVVDLVGRAIVEGKEGEEGGPIRPGFSAELDELKAMARDARAYLAGLERAERERTGCKTIKVGYNKVFGYYLEVSTAALKAPYVGDGQRTSLQEHLEQRCGYVRKQTLVGAERYVTPELKEKEALILSAQERVEELEQTVFRTICRQVAGSGEAILSKARALALLDCCAALAEVATRHDYVRPTLAEDGELRILEGRHPVIEQTLEEGRFVANDALLGGDGPQIAILTGPNMGGKSTYLRQVALIVLLAQIGSFVPARAAHVGIVDRIFTRVGAQDDLARGQSTFMVEMAETAAILHQATPRSLVLLDEIGRGTSTYDGLAIAQAVVEYLHNHPRLGCKTLFATHYHELTELDRRLPRVRNFHVAVLEEGEEAVFLYRVEPGGANRSYGIHVARLAGVPKAITRRAEELLQALENGRTRRAPSGRSAPSPLQLPLFAEPNPVVEELKTLDVLSLTPIEALAKLFELQERAREHVDISGTAGRGRKE